MYADHILFLNLSSKVWELFIVVARWKTAQIIKTINISRCQYYKLDWFRLEFIAKIQLTWDAVVVQTRLSFFLYVSVQMPTPTSIFRVEFPRVICGVAKSYSRQASKVTSTANSDKAAQKWFSFPGIIVRDIRLCFKCYFFFQLFSHQALPQSQKVHDEMKLKCLTE